MTPSAERTPPMTTVAQLGEHLRTLFTTTADAVARRCGFVQRRSKVSGAVFAQAAYWLSRLQPGTAIFDPQGRRRALRTILRGAAMVDWAVQLGVHHHLPARLLALRVPPEVANQRRRRLRAAAADRGRTPTADSLALADWTILVTNAASDRLSFKEAFVLQRARWQVELLFKLWKSNGL